MQTRRCKDDNLALVRLLILAPELRRNQIERAFGLRPAHPFFQSPYCRHGRPAPFDGAPAHFKSWLHHHGEPEFRRGRQFRAAEFRWGDANDRIIPPADEQTSANDLRISAEPLLPALVTQHHDWMPPGRKVV